MNVLTVSDKLFGYLISNISGDSFEVLAKSLFVAEIGDEFVPLGGMHDGGADGFLELRLSNGKKAGTFFQFSVTDKDSARSKILQTITALTKAGREPTQLVYATNQLLPKQDVLQSEVFEKYKVLLVVKDGERLKHIVNADSRANRVFHEFFAADITELKHKAESLRGSVNQFVKDPTVFAFLDHELKDRFVKDHLQDCILDSLIYWALRETDPGAEKTMMGKGQIADAISVVFPTATSVLVPKLAARLLELSKKNNGERERVRHHTVKDLFCLPYEMRKQLAEQALEESKLQENFLEG